MARPVSILDITETERTELQRRLNSPTTAQRDSLRAAIVLRRGEGIKQEQVAEQLGVSKACVNKWSQRFEREGLEGLEDRKGRGRPASIPAHKVEQVITRGLPMIGKLLGCPQVQTPARYSPASCMLRSSGASPNPQGRYYGVSGDPENPQASKSGCRETRTSPEGPGPP